MVTKNDKKERGPVSEPAKIADQDIRGGTSQSLPVYKYTTESLKRAIIEDAISNMTPGKENARIISHRDNNSWDARYWRQAVHDHNVLGDMAVINDGDGLGYYIPDLTRDEEIAAAYAYADMLKRRAATSIEAAEGIERWLKKGGAVR